MKRYHTGNAPIELEASKPPTNLVGGLFFGEAEATNDAWFSKNTTLSRRDVRVRKSEAMDSLLKRQPLRVEDPLWADH